MKFKYDEDSGDWEEKPKRGEAKDAMCPSITKAEEHGIFSALMLTMPEVTLGACHGFMMAIAELQREENLGIMESGNAMSTIMNALAVGMKKLNLTHANLNTIMAKPEFAHFRLGLTCLYKALVELGYNTAFAAADLELIKQYTVANKDIIINNCKAMGRSVEGLEGFL